MMLTGKAKEDFEKWSGGDFHESYYHFINTLIIEWLDSVGIYITISPRGKDNSVAYWFNDEICSDISFANNRQEAEKEAIKQANIIYNER